MTEEVVSPNPCTPAVERMREEKKRLEDEPKERTRATEEVVTLDLVL